MQHRESGDGPGGWFRNERAMTRGNVNSRHARSKNRDGFCEDLMRWPGGAEYFQSTSAGPVPFMNSSPASDRDRGPVLHKGTVQIRNAGLIVEQTSRRPRLGPWLANASVRNILASSEREEGLTPDLSATASSTPHVAASRESNICHARKDSDRGVSSGAAALTRPGVQPRSGCGCTPHGPPGTR